MPELHPAERDKKRDHTGGGEQRVPEFFVCLKEEGHYCDQQNGVGQIPPGHVYERRIHKLGKSQSIYEHAESNMGNIHVDRSVELTEGLSHDKLSVQSGENIDKDGGRFQLDKPF